MHGLHDQDALGVEAELAQADPYRTTVVPLGEAVVRRQRVVGIVTARVLVLRVTDREPEVLLSKFCQALDVHRSIVKRSCTLVPRLGGTATLQQHGLVGEFAAEYVENLHRGAVGPCLEVNVGLRLLHSARGPFIPCLLFILLHRQSPGLVLALHACFLVPFHNRSPHRWCQFFAHGCLLPSFLHC